MLAFENLIYVLIGGFILLFVWNIFLQISFSSFKKRQKKLFAGKKGRDLEKVILDQKEELDDLGELSKELSLLAKENRLLVQRSFHKSGLVRFNPFNDVGGDQSFSLALLDSKNDGVTISSLYSREGVRIYAKAITGGKNEKYSLTQEEQEAISIASSQKASK